VPDCENMSFRPSKWPQKFGTRKTAKNSKLLKKCFEPVGIGGWPQVSSFMSFLECICGFFSRLGYIVLSFYFLGVVFLTGFSSLYPFLRGVFFCTWVPNNATYFPRPISISTYSPKLHLWGGVGAYVHVLFSHQFPCIHCLLQCPCCLL
jgi:hypothetical protein